MFYNPVQNVNRDLSVFEIKTFGEGFVRERVEWRKSTKQQGGEGAKHSYRRGRKAKQQNAIRRREK